MCFDLLSCAGITVCAAVFENKYGKNLELIENKPEKKVMPAPHISVFTAQLLTRVFSKKEYTL